MKSIPSALAVIAAGRDHLTTEEFAKAANRAVQTIRKNYCTQGECFGIKPLKFGNRLLWPVEQIAKLLNGEVPTSRSMLSVLPMMEWVDLDAVLPLLRERMAKRDGGKWITDEWSCKYIDARIDMRTGAIFMKPGNTAGSKGVTYLPTPHEEKDQCSSCGGRGCKACAPRATSKNRQVEPK